MHKFNYNKILVLEKTKSIFDKYALKFKEVAYHQGLKIGNVKISRDELLAGIGIYLQKVLEKNMKFLPKEDKEYPAILYAEVIIALKQQEKEKIREIKDRVDTLLFKDIVFPEWKDEKRWYSPEIYSAMMAILLRKVFPPNHYMHHIENYIDVMDCANLAYKLYITDPYNLPKGIH